MVENAVAHDDTSMVLGDKETSVASSTAIEVTQFPWSPLCGGDATLCVQNLIGVILKWHEQELNLGFNPVHRGYFFRIAESLGALADETRKGTIPEIILESGQLRIGASLVSAWEQRLEELRQLPDNWDSYGAPRITDKALEKARSVLTLMTATGSFAQPFVAPSPNGGVQIEWYIPTGEVELRIPPNGDPLTYSTVETTADGQEREVEETIPRTDSLARLLQKITL